MFFGQVDMLSRLHSSFLVGLIGYCADQDHRLLVYEHMSNGSLQEHLYSDGEVSRVCLFIPQQGLGFIVYNFELGVKIVHI